MPEDYDIHPLGKVSGFRLIALEFALLLLVRSFPGALGALPTASKRVLLGTLGEEWAEFPMMLFERSAMGIVILEGGGW